MKKYSIIFLFLSACGSVERVDTSRIQEAIEHRKVKRVTEAQIVAIANAKGGELLKIIEANTLCQVSDSLQKRFYCQANLRTEQDLQNKALQAKEIQLLDAYLYNIENKQAIGENLQKLGDTLFLYTAPVPASVKQKCYSKAKFAVWSFQFSKKDLIRNTTLKELKNI